MCVYKTSELEPGNISSMKGLPPIKTVNNGNIFKTISVDRIVKKPIDPVMSNNLEVFSSSLLILFSLLIMGLFSNLVSIEIFLIIHLKFYI